MRFAVCLAVLAGLTACTPTPEPVAVEPSSPAPSATSVALAASAASSESATAPAPTASEAVKPTPASVSRLIGHWRVVGCATSPMDPAPCAHGDIVFEADRWSVQLGLFKKTGSYTVVSEAKDRIVISTEGEEEEVLFRPNGSANWYPPLGNGRIRTLSFVRVP